jgi:hypothetical protein
LTGCLLAKPARVAIMMYRIFLLTVLVLFLAGSVSAQWSLQVAREMRTYSSTPATGPAALSANSFFLERNVAFIPFLRLSARIGIAKFENIHELTGPSGAPVIGERKTTINEFTGAALLGIPLGRWLRLYGGYGYVIERSKAANTLSGSDVSVNSIEEQNFALQTIYGARIYLGRYVAVNYEVRALDYEKENIFNAKKRTALGLSVHF